MEPCVRTLEKFLKNNRGKSAPFRLRNASSLYGRGRLFYSSVGCCFSRGTGVAPAAGCDAQRKEPIKNRSPQRQAVCRTTEGLQIGIATFRRRSTSPQQDRLFREKDRERFGEMHCLENGKPSAGFGVRPSSSKPMLGLIISGGNR
jgi:hypothetical protein